MNHPFCLYTFLFCMSITNLIWNLYQASKQLLNLELKHAAEEASFHPRKREDSPSCALLFFGLLKQPDTVIPGIINNVISPNKNCDIFAHTYNITSTSNRRNNEMNSSLNPTEIYRITNNVIMESESNFLLERNLTFYRQFFPHTDTSWVYPTSMDNMIKQWHSIETVWNYMEESNKHKSYRRIGLFRSDLLYTEPINIQLGGDAVFPYYGTHYIRGYFNSINDRMFYGSYENAKIWATQRFPSVPTFIKIRKELPGVIPSLRSETYLAWLFENLVDDIDFRSMCGWRVRATGELKKTDCMGPKLIKLNAKKLDKGHNTTISRHDPKCTEDQINLEKALLYHESYDPGFYFGVPLYLQKHNACVYINQPSQQTKNNTLLLLSN